MKKTILFASIFIGVASAQYSAVIPKLDSSNTVKPIYLIDDGNPSSPTLPPVDYNPPLTQIEKITASDGASYDWFGRSLNIDDNSLIVSSKCKIYIQDYDGSNWQNQTILTSNDYSGACEYIRSSDIDGDWLAFGTYGTKSVYIFQKQSGVWTQHSKLTGSESKYGWSVAIDDGKILVSSGDDYEGYYRANQDVYAYEFDGSSWNLTQTISTALANHGFGNSIRMSGNRAIIGAPQQATSSGAGEAVILEHDGSEWKETALLSPSNGADGDSFGHYVSIDGDSVIIGAPSFYNNHGSAYVFEYDGNNWNESILDSGDNAKDEYFGDSVSISGNLAIVGASFMTENGVRSGNAYIFKKDGNNWVKSGSVAPNDPTKNDSFGVSVVMHRGTAFVGATYEDEKGSAAGSVYVYSE